MKKSYVTIVLTLACMLGLGISAHAEDQNKVVVNVQFDFIVAGSRTMPAGTYTISRVSQDPRSGLVIHSGNRNALVLPVDVGEPSGVQAGLGFEHVGDKYYLSTIQTPGGAYTVQTGRAITKLAQTRSKDHVVVSASGN